MSADDDRALLRGLRRVGDEAQLTQAIAAVARADEKFAREFAAIVLPGRDDGAPVAAVTVTAEEIVEGGRVDLRLRAEALDAIVEIKIHAGYRPNQLEDYQKTLDASAARERHLIAITRDVPTFAEPSYVHALRWRDLLPRLRQISCGSVELTRQWRLFLDVLETEGSMGFTRPDPRLFTAYGEVRQALIHMEEFMRVLRVPLLQALRAARGGDEHAAGFYWKQPRFGRTRHGRISVPFRVPADGPWRVRAGVISWHPPTPSFFVQCGPDQRWDRRHVEGAARDAVEALVAGGFDSQWMAAYLPLTDEVISPDALEERVLAWAHDRFADIERSGFFAVPADAFGAAKAPDADETEA